MNTTSDLKRKNTQAILRLIHHGRKISKNEVAEQLGLSSVTAHTIIKELCDKNLCSPSDEVRYRGGRNAIAFQINGDFGYIISVLLNRKEITVAVFDFALQLHYLDRQPLDIKDVWPCINFAEMQIEKACAAFSKKNILGIGISMPGRTDKNGTIISIPEYPQWKHIPLGSIYRDHFHLPVVIDNDNNALLLSTRWIGPSSTHKSIAYLFINDGVSMGFFSNGKLFHGNNGFACEIGHTSIRYDGPPCSCGNRGCIQNFLSNEALCNAMNEVMAKKGRPSFQNMEEVLRYMAAARDLDLYQILYDAIPFLALLFSHIINVFDPQVIYIRCYWLNAFPELFSLLNEMIQKSCPWMRPDRISILLDNDEQILLSAPACLFLESYFRHSLPV